MKINLLAAQKSEIKKAKKEFFLSTVVSLIVGGVFVAGVIGTTGYALVVKKQYQNTLDKIETQKKKIKSFSKQEYKYTYLKDKVGALVEILSETQKQQAVAYYVLTLFPQEIPIGGFSIGKDWQVEISGQAKRFSLLRKTLDQIISQPETENELVAVEGLTLNSLSKVDEDGGYQFSITIDFE